MTNLEVNGLGLEELSQKEAKSIDGGLVIVIGVGSILLATAAWAITRRRNR